MANQVSILPNPKFTHCTVAHRFVTLPALVANARLFEIACLTAAKIVVLTRLRIEVVQTAVHTAALLDFFEAFRVSGFTAVDTTNTATPVAVPKQTGEGQALTPAVIRGMTAAGHANGMTGGTLSKATFTSPFLSRGMWMLAAVPTTPNTNVMVAEYNPMLSGSAPMVFKFQEGFIVENGVLLGAAAASAVSIEADFGIGDGS